MVAAGAHKGRPDGQSYITVCSQRGNRGGGGPCARPQQWGTGRLRREAQRDRDLSRRPAWGQMPLHQSIAVV